MKQLNNLPFAHETITIYNKYTYLNMGGKVVTRWISTQIPNCFIRGQQISNVNGTIIVGDDKTLIKIPMFDNFLLPFDYLRLLNDIAYRHFTVNDGDIIVTRAVKDEINDLFTDLDILQKYGSLAMVVKSVNYNTSEFFPLPHIEVIA